jgi:hypothetical protein
LLFLREILEAEITSFLCALFFSDKFTKVTGEYSRNHRVVRAYIGVNENIGNRVVRKGRRDARSGKLDLLSLDRLVVKEPFYEPNHLDGDLPRAYGSFNILIP